MTFDPKIITSAVYPKIIPLPSLNTFGSFVSSVIVQRTNRLSDRIEDRRLTHATTFGVSN